MLEDNYKQRGLRNKLVKKLRLKGIADEAVLTAIGKVPRHVFFDDALLAHAYEDKAFPIGEGQPLLMAFFAGDGIVSREPGLIKEQAAQINAFAGKRVIRRDIGPVPEVGWVNQFVGFSRRVDTWQPGNGAKGCQNQEEYE